MRLISYNREGRLRHGFLDSQDQVKELGEGDLGVLLASDTPLTPEQLTVVAGPWAQDAVQIVAPLANPPKLLAAAANYQDHVKEGGGEALDKTRLAPRLFLKPATSIAGPEQPVALPSFSTQLDWEAELAVVIGRTGKDISVDDALDHVAGYCCSNDVSARSVDYGFERDADAAVNYFDWLAGKWGDGFAPLGPWLVTADEVGDPQSLTITFDLNGKRHQDGSTSDMIFSVAELIAHASRLSTLLPGDVLLTGTPAGVGAASGLFLKAGDQMAVSISGLGTLNSPVVAG